MCLGLPGRIVQARSASVIARVDVAGIVRDINVELLDGPLRPGEYVLVHSGFALERMSADEAREALTLFASDGSADDEIAMPR